MGQGNDDIGVQEKLVVVGGGAWGTALAAAAARAGTGAVALWAREEQVVADINTTHINGPFLADIPLPENLRATADMADLSDGDIVLLVPPAQHLRGVLGQLRPHLKPDAVLVIASKGIEASTGMLLSTVVAEVAPKHPIAILSGPTFAAEVARGLPCAMTIAAEDNAVAERITARMGHTTVRLYASRDVIGAQIGGAVKNVMAIAAGIVHGMQLGENARAALITRGLAEIIRFGVAMGADASTLTGLSGLGDLLLTCSSLQSRNMSLGYELGQGRAFADIMASRNTVAEGAHSVTIVRSMAEDWGVDMPISRAVYAIVHDAADATAEMQALLSRPFTEELPPDG